MFNASMLTFWQVDTIKDPLAVADMLETDWYTTPVVTDRFATFRLGHINSVNTPYGNGDTDFFYHMYKLKDGNWIRLVAYDVRSNNIFAICKRDGYWQSWQEITSNVEIYGVATLDPNYVTSGVIHWVKRGKFCTLNFENVVFQNISGYSDTPFATGIPRPLYGGSYGVLQYDTMEGHGFVSIANVNNNGAIRPDAFLNVNADTYGAIVYMTAD